MFRFVWQTHMCVLHIGIYVRTVDKSIYVNIFFILQVQELKKKARPNNLVIDILLETVKDQQNSFRISFLNPNFTKSHSC